MNSSAETLFSTGATAHFVSSRGKKAAHEGGYKTLPHIPTEQVATHLPHTRGKEITMTNVSMPALIGDSMEAVGHAWNATTHFAGDVWGATGGPVVENTKDAVGDASTGIAGWVQKYPLVALPVIWLATKSARFVDYVGDKIVSAILMPPAMFIGGVTESVVIKARETLFGR
ncbi:MAG: hypothetical protein V4437_01040 [Patescibacteria group bacterium]